MPDLRNYTRTVDTDANVNVAKIRVQGQFFDDTTGQMIVDLTGANAVTFAFRVAGKNAAWHKDFVDEFGELILKRVAGL